MSDAPISPLPHDLAWWADYAARSRAPAEPGGHDPLVCGIDPTTDCDACRAAAVREVEEALGPTDHALRRWDELRGQRWGLLGRCAAGPGERPPMMTAEQLGRLVWALLRPESRALLRAVLLDLLGADIVRAISAAVHAAHGRNGRAE